MKIVPVLALSKLAAVEEATANLSYQKSEEIGRTKFCWKPVRKMSSNDGSHFDEWIDFGWLIRPMNLIHFVDIDHRPPAEIDNRHRLFHTLIPIPQVEREGKKEKNEWKRERE